MDIDHIPDSAIIYLNEKGSKLISRALKKAGSKRELIKNVLLYKGRSPDVTRLNKIMNGEQGIPKYRYVKLLQYLEIPSDEALNFVRKIKIKST
jgi:hypothetical protein